MTGAGEARGPSGPPRFWPAGRPPAPEVRVEARCAACGQLWWVHEDLGGFRLRCGCGAWVSVPGRFVASPSPKALGGDHEPRDLEPFHLPHDGTLRHSSVEERRRWIDRSLLELGGILLAFTVPIVIALLAFGPAALPVYLPFASLIGGAAVLLVGLGSARHAFGALRSTAPRYFAEAVGVAALGLALAFGWTAILEAVQGGAGDEIGELRAELGVGWSLFVIGVCPAFFEELAFRGLIQGRLTALLGRNQGILVTGAAFALAHGVSPAFPIHAGLGLYLCWLRARCDSLLPGMLLHFLYNSAIVLAF